VAATAVNRADLVQRTGHYPPPAGASPILGLECAGVVDEVGAYVNWPKPGDEVCALLAGGGYAEYVVFPASHALPVPKGMSLLEAAAVPEVFTTAWLNLRREGELIQGERVLIHAAASGVGTAALQLCLAWGNPTFATVGSAAKEARCRALGAQATANRKDGPWLGKVTAWGAVDVILDPVGGAYLESNIHALRERGRLVNIGLMGGREGTLPMGPLLVKRLSIRGSVLRSRSEHEKTDILSAMKEEVWPLLDDGTVRPIIDEVFDIERAQDAHELVGRNGTVGKVVLRVPLG
jgi:putative PIG3 family NAD(P)H quinone oxidoreductase